jgi:uncharacterized membrane protein YfcA
MFKEYSSTWDRAGGIASGACIIHCLFLPLLVAFVPGLVHFLPTSEYAHRFLILVLLFIGTLAFLSGYRIHKKKIVLLFMLSGLSVISLGAFIGDAIASHIAETTITTFGSIILIVAHRINRTFCKQCYQCNCTNDCKNN